MALPHRHNVEQSIVCQQWRRSATKRSQAIFKTSPGSKNVTGKVDRTGPRIPDDVTSDETPLEEPSHTSPRMRAGWWPFWMWAYWSL